MTKLAALLRVADALERTHAQRVSQIEIRRDGGKLRLRLPGLADAAVERLAMASKAGIKITHVPFGTGLAMVALLGGKIEPDEAYFGKSETAMAA